MNRALKWLLIALAVAALLFGAIAIALKSWVGSDDFRLRVAKEISTAAGVPVELGALTVDVWPLPAIAVDRVQVKSKPALSFERIEARPVWSALLQKRLEISTLYVRNAVIPQEAIAAVAAAHRKAHPENPKERKAQPESAAMQLPRRIVLDKVTWVDSRNNRNVIDATARIDDDGLPAQVDIDVGQGRWQGVQAKLQRTNNRWALNGRVGGGNITGRFETSKTPRASRNCKASSILRTWRCQLSLHLRRR